MLESKNIMELRAVIFDIDGTLAETERNGHRIAFNRAFEQLRLPDRWDETLYGKLVCVAGGRERLRFYFEHYRPIPTDEQERLVTEAHKLKNEAFRELIDKADISPRPGILRLFDELYREDIAIAVATSGDRVLIALVEKLLGRGRLKLIITGEDVAYKKPHPEIYETTLSRLGFSANESLAIEDSRNGLEAAKRAGLPCLIVRSYYSQDQDFSEADLVVDDLGDPGLPSPVVYNCHSIEVGDMITVETLRRLHKAANAQMAIRHNPVDYDLNYGFPKKEKKYNKR